MNRQLDTECTFVFRQLVFVYQITIVLLSSRRFYCLCNITDIQLFIIVRVCIIVSCLLQEEGQCNDRGLLLVNHGVNWTNGVMMVMVVMMVMMVMMVMPDCGDTG